LPAQAASQTGATRTAWISQAGDWWPVQARCGAAVQQMRAGRAWAGALAWCDLSDQLATAAGDIGWPLQRWVSVERGDTRLLLGDLNGALTAYRAGMAIAERLAASDRDNAGWQRDLSVSHERIGDVLQRQGDLNGALAAYRAGMTIAERLAASDRDNADWQRDLSVSHERIGDVLQRQGDLNGALTAYRAGMTIRERLAASDRDNADWQRDLFVSLFKITTMLLAANDREAARPVAQRLNEQASLLADRFPQDPQCDDYVRAAADLLARAAPPVSLFRRLWSRR
jgi:tetratricopeptide (TPR) repeat protein